MINLKFFNLKKIITIFLILSFGFSFKAFGAKEGGIERIRSCENGQLEGFDPIHTIDSTGSIRIGKEMDFVLNNPVCLTQVLAIYTTVKLTIAGINGACSSGSAYPRPFPSPIQDAIDLTRASANAVRGTGGQYCKQTLLAGAIPILQTFTQLGIIYETAKAEYQSVRVCGSDWQVPDPEIYKFSEDIAGSHHNYLKTFASSAISTNLSGFNYNSSKEYREWIHGGKEFEDKVADGQYCQDPSRGNNPQRYYMRGLRSGIFLCEKYNPIFLSNRNSETTDAYKKAYDCCLSRSRYFICLNKSARDNAVWNSTDHIFCKANSKCSFVNNQAVIYETYKRDNNRLICAKSYSLCPFNFSIGGGTIYPDYFKDGVVSNGRFIPFNEPGEDSLQNPNNTICQSKSEIREPNCKLNNKAGKLKNYCQYYTHCTVANTIHYNGNFDSMSPYFSKACLNFIGDSQNGITNGSSYASGLSLGSHSNFSAPIVQCFKETMENIFTNKAGHSKCNDGSFGDLSGICKDASGQDSYVRTVDNFIYKKGNQVKKSSLFEILQVRLKNIITLVLIISVTFLGAKILILKIDIQNKKEILTYIIKIAFVIYFVNGDAWKSIFFDGIYNGSNEISRMFFKINSVSQDGNDQCNFGATYDRNGALMQTPATYPAGKRYLMIWDTLDCKIMKYLNYGPGFSSSTIFLLIVASFFTGGIGLIIALSVFILAFCMIATVIRAMHIFIASAIAIIVYVFVSPIIIPLILFERTKSIFDAWLNHLMSFTLQPIILFSYVAIFITLSEKILYNNALIIDNKLVCSKYCMKNTGEPELDLKKCTTPPAINQATVATSSATPSTTPPSTTLVVPSSTANNRNATLYGDIINPLDVNVSCILGFNDFKDNNGFALFGVVLPSLGNILSGGSEAINNRIMLILKSALFLYILAQFADEISGVTSRLIGENIDIRGQSGFEMLKKFTNNVRSIQKRGARFAQIQASGQLKKASAGLKKSDDGGGGGGDDSSDGVGGDDKKEDGVGGDDKKEDGVGG